jgi:hypothetical protein
MLSRRQIIIILLLRRRSKRRQRTTIKRRRYWVHPIHQARKELGAYYKLLPQLVDDEEKFFNYMRMDRNSFQTLLQWIGPKYEFLLPNL